MLALYHRHPTVIEALLTMGVKPDLHEACALGRAGRVTELLAAAPEGVNSIGADGFTPISLAAYFGHSDLVVKLLQSGADPNLASANTFKATALHAAVAGRQPEVVASLLAFGADANARQADAYTPLHAAAQDGQMAMVELLLEGGAEINPVTTGGETPCGLASAANHWDVAYALRDRGGIG